MAYKRSIILDPTYFSFPEMDADIEAINNPARHYGWYKQPLWPYAKKKKPNMRRVYLSANDKTNRRKLIEALVSSKSSQELTSIGYKILICERDYPCKSPLCNYCRSKIQKEYQKRILKYFKDTKKKNIFWVTILDDLSYDPVNDVPKRSVSLKRKIKGAFHKSPIIDHAKVFAAFELDVKKTDQMEDNDAAINLLSQYGSLDNGEVAFMPHYHAIVAIDDMATPEQLAGELRKTFPKSKQVSVGRLHLDKTKEDNLKILARYMFKFRYQFSDNILKDKPAYGSRFDNDTLRLYAQAVHSIIGERGLVQYDLSYNLY